METKMCKNKKFAHAFTVSYAFSHCVHAEEKGMREEEREAKWIYRSKPWPSDAHCTSGTSVPVHIEAEQYEKIQFFFPTFVSRTNCPSANGEVRTRDNSARYLCISLHCVWGRVWAVCVCRCRVTHKKYKLHANFLHICVRNNNNKTGGWADAGDRRCGGRRMNRQCLCRKSYFSYL